MKVFETQLPGVGDRFTVRFDDGCRLVVLIRNDGTREVFWREAGDVGGEPLFEVGERGARTIAEIFDGSYFSPVGDDIEDALENAVVEWVEVTAGAPLVGQTLGEADVRGRTGATVLAIRRNERTIGNPGADARVAAGDVLVVVGEQEAHEALERFLTGEE